MDQNDYIGIGTSVVLHLLLGILFSFLTASRPVPPQLGYVEVEFGEFQSGRPVEAVDEAPEASAPEEEQPEPETPTEPEPEPEEVTEPEPEPVEAPQEDPQSEETVPPTEEETTTPEPQPEPQPEEGADEQESDDESGAETGDPGEGADEQKSAPYNIEGLNRDPITAPLPQYTEKVDATISFIIRVGPDGRVVGLIPARMGGSPELQNEVKRVLNRWRFNALPPAAPQEVQRGTITFTFRLE
ncbi:energy transducer TonB [Longibacter salinarum]|uniref:Energy transducer TonB n=1 Tax=Longibacter salinarum TaxID=1850348 RepID=A0A2A8CYJ7_9BACT|nr:energy transducer TonB [Longibacter salinarum]PEN13809.1 energy transducer TonB [Longibacter salinarum]